ncbi:MAG: 50S ribosomal protein L10 [Saprospiraceae bacterium]|jgi:large subunit ribosomal protein L10|nr:50S ribosomal protein L10 [Saprospiraceae bacterium]
MTRAEKTAVIEELKSKFESSQFFYVADSSALPVEKINNLRGLFFEKGIEMRVVKNTLVKKALESFGEEKNYAPLYDTLAGPTSIIFSDVANAPARVIKDFRKDDERPLIKSAYIDSAVFVGDDQIDALAKLKSKEELLGEIVTLLQSPIQNLVGALNSGQNKVTGLLKALEERGE